MTDNGDNMDAAATAAAARTNNLRALLQLELYIDIPVEAIY